MASTTINRPSVSTNVRSDGSQASKFGLTNSTQPRTTRFGDYTSTAGTNLEDATARSSSLGQNIPTWGKPNIWAGGNTIGSGAYAMNKRETPRSQGKCIRAMTLLE